MGGPEALAGLNLPVPFSKMPHFSQDGGEGEPHGVVVRGHSRVADC